MQRGGHTEILSPAQQGQHAKSWSTSLERTWLQVYQADSITEPNLH